MFKELFTEDRMSVSKATISKNKRYEAIYGLEGDESDIEIYDNQEEKVIVDKMDIPEKEVKQLLKKYNLK
jgi:cytidylate kinase